MNISRRSILSQLGVFTAASVMSPIMRVFATTAEDAAKPLGSYWQAHLDEVARKVNELAKITVDGFWFITDLHIVSNRRQSGKIIAALTPRTPLKKTLCGGDLPEAFAARYARDRDGVDLAVNEYRLFWRDLLERAGQTLYTAKGNHDFTIRHDPKANTGFTLTNLEARAVVMDSEGCRHAITNPADPEACYYYFDNPQAKIRYIVADTTDSIDPTRTWWAVKYGMGETQLVWLAEKALATTPDGWGIVVMNHIPLSICVGDKGSEALFRPFRTMLEAYQNRGVARLGKHTFDYRGVKARILFNITGHEHAERQTFRNGVLHVTEPCDCAYGDYIFGSHPWCGKLPVKRGGTIFEQTFDAVQIDTARDVVYFTRVGGGQNRAIHLKPIVCKVGQPYTFTASLLQAGSDGVYTWGCYDADKIEFRKNPVSQYCPLISYVADYGTINAKTGVFTPTKPGDVMVLARNDVYQKEIFPVKVVE